MRGLMIVVGLSLVAGTALAQSPHVDRERAYCERLYEAHERYVERLARRGMQMRDPMADLAVDRCRHARIAEGVPVLEAKLQSVRIPLPER